jgi:hypothetical protein
MFCRNPNSLKEWKHIADAVLGLLLSSSSLQLQFVCLWMVIAEWKIAEVVSDAKMNLSNILLSGFESVQKTS